MKEGFYMLIKIIKNEKKEGLIGFVMQGKSKGKVCFLNNIDIPYYLTGEGTFEVSNENIEEHEKFLVLNKIDFPILEDLESGLKVLKNACNCRFCSGWKANNAQYVAGSRNPRAYYFDKDKIVAESLTVNGSYYEENGIVQIHNYGENYKFEGTVIYEDSDSVHGCSKIVEHQSVIFIKKV